MTCVDIDLIGVPVFVLDVEEDGGFRIAGSNRANAQAIGLTAAMSVGRRIEDCASAEAAAFAIGRFSACVAAGRFLEYDQRMDADGAERWWHTTLTPRFDPVEGRVTQIVGVSVEITGRRRAEAALVRDATIDPLTGALNRRGLIAHLDAMAAQPDAASRAFGIAVVDLDGFKAINDRHGHQAGDAVLRHVAQLFLASAAPGEIVARTGGDEFALVLDVADRSDLDVRLEEFRRSLRHAPAAAGTDVRARSSIGGALWEPGRRVEDLLAEADADMYRRKRAARQTR